MKTLLVILIFIMFPVSAQVATAERVIFFEWGEGKNQVGLLVDDMPYGPNYYDIDKEGMILISDEFNKCFKKFDKNGNLIWEISPERGKHPGKIVSLKNGNILYSNGFEIIFGNKEGKTIKEIDSKKFRGIGLKGVDVTDEHIFLTGHRGDVFVFDTTITLQQQYLRNQLPNPGCFIINGDFYFVDMRTDRQHISVKKVNYTPTGLAEGFSKAPILKLPQREGLTAFRGVDQYGNLYFSTKFSPSEPYLFEKFDPTGKKLGNIKIDWQIAHEVFNPFKVSPEGDIYVLSSNKKGMWIDKYPAYLFDAK